MVCIEGTIRFLINGKTVADTPIQDSHPRHVLVDVYGPVKAVKVLPMQWRDSLVLRIGQLPKEMTRTKICCQYFQLCRRFLSAQRCTISGICLEKMTEEMIKCPWSNEGVQSIEVSLILECSALGQCV